MIDTEITALAREYGEYVANNPIVTPCLTTDEKKDICIRANANRAKDVIKWIADKFCLVEKSKLQELEIARRAKEHGAVWLNQWEAESLFPEIAKEEEE